MTIHESRKYTATDLGACRYIKENPTGGGTYGRFYADVAAAGPLTPAIAQRLERIKLAEGAGPSVPTIADGTQVWLTGLGQKQAAEAVRLGVPAIS